MLYFISTSTHIATQPPSRLLTRPRVAQLASQFRPVPPSLRVVSSEGQAVGGQYPASRRQLLSRFTCTLRYIKSCRATKCQQIRCILRRAFFVRLRWTQARVCHAYLLTRMVGMGQLALIHTRTSRRARLALG